MAVVMGAASGQPGRYQRSTSGMVGALLVTLLVIGAFVAFRACNRTDLEVQPDHVDYLAQVGFAQQAGDRVVYPASLPAGWFATQLTVDGGPPTNLQLSMLTGQDEYVGFVQSPDSAPVLLTRYVDAAPVSGGPTDVPGAMDGAVTRWDLWTDDGGDTALVARHAGETLLVFGTASEGQLEQLAGTLTTARLAR
jgi:Protein of unknown function (DUF4245)